MMRRTLLLAATCAGGLLSLGQVSAGAATIAPTTNFFTDDFAENGNCSLREAIEVANDNASGAPEDSCVITGAPLGNDTVQLQAGTYFLELEGAEGGNPNANSDLDPGGAGTITIDGAGASDTAIDTEAGWLDRVIHLSLLTPTSSTITDLTITGGNDQSASGGGGIFAAPNQSLTLERVRVTQNAAVNVGGGIGTDGPSLVVSDSEISLNTSSGGNGGGVETAAATTIDDSVISQNSATKASVAGGGILAPSGNLTMTDTIVAGNSATDPGITGTPIGGGMRVTNSTATIRRSTISGNQLVGGTPATGGTAQNGAGLHVGGGATVTLSNSTVSGNEADGDGGFGGGLRVDGATATVVYSTFAGNTISGTESGSGLFLGAGSLNVRASIVETSGAAAACGGPVNSLGDNVFTDNSCGPETGNDDADADPLLTPLADQGGPRVGAPGFELPLQTRTPGLSSTAIDHVPADCDDAPSGLLTGDERGFPRPFDSDGDTTADCEAGAVEVFPCLGQSANRVGTSGAETLTGIEGANDVIAAFGGNDTLIGLSGNDRLCGGDGDDTLRGGADDDQLDGGANTAPIVGGDFASFSDSASAVTASVAANSASGDGADTFAPGTIENLAGSPQGDTLTGDAGPNLLGGGAGDDDLNGLGGDDGMDGQVGTADEALFAGAPGGVTATLQDSPTQGSATGFGTDILFGLEEISGGTFGDTLTGNGGANVLRGLAGDDTLTGLAGGDFLALGADADTANSQDGLADTIDCTGGGTDTGTLDTSPAENFIGCDGDGDGVESFFDACPTQAGTLADGCSPPPADPGNPGNPADPGTPAPKKCKKGQKLKKGKCVKRKRKKKK